MEQNDDFKWLQYWYFANCDGDWEHSEGILIDTLDNPGWSLTINLKDTDVENKPFIAVKIHRDEDDWLEANVEADSKSKDKNFKAICGPQNLSEVTAIFRAWVGDQITFHPKGDYYWHLKKPGILLAAKSEK